MIIKIKNLRFKTFLGIHQWEKHIEREIIINAVIETDHNLAMQSDNIADTIDYDVIIAKIKNFIENNHCQLIEKMVGEIMNLIMEDQRIKSCQLEIDKMGVVANVDSFSVVEKREIRN